jgi:hypothetical protein
MGRPYLPSGRSEPLSARELAQNLWYAKVAAEAAEALYVPLDWLEAAVGAVGKIAVNVAVDWLARTSEMMWKCGNSNWSIVGVKANICKLAYKALDVAGTLFIDSTSKARVWACLDNSGKTCFHQVYPDKPEEEKNVPLAFFALPTFSKGSGDMP